MSRARYEIVGMTVVNEREIDIVTIRDLDGPVSVTNDAEAVVKEVIAWYHENGNQRPFRIHFFDTDGRKDELKHFNGEFAGFAPVDP